jgi:hypothetical protein
MTFGKVAASFAVIFWVGIVGTSGAFRATPQMSFVKDNPLDRQGFLETTAVSFALLVGVPSASNASGGATAGGAYLLSAKQRYNDRVKAGIKGFLALGPSIASGDFDAIRPYFLQEDVGGWKDFATAAYLLANAFRRNSTAAPDSLPSVKVSNMDGSFLMRAPIFVETSLTSVSSSSCLQKWKVVAAQVDALTKAINCKSKNVAAAQTTYQSALMALDDYLSLVGLPLAKDL